MIMFIGHKCYTQNPIRLLIAGSNIHRFTLAKIILDVKQTAHSTTISLTGEYENTHSYRTLI